MGLFDFMPMFDNYEERKVARYENGPCLVSTAAVNDSGKPFETAVCHPFYNEGHHVIVELYDTKEDALKGHERWVEKMTTNPLPERLLDVSTCDSAVLCRELGGKLEYGIDDETNTEGESQ